MANKKYFAIGCLGVVLLGILVVVLFVTGTYNSLVGLDQKAQAQWGQVENAYQRRADLIPNLVETVKGYAKHESGVFERVTQARSAAVNAQTVKAQGEADNMLTGALKSLFAVAEAYPELKANQNFLMLQEELAGTESKVAYARQFYNDVVMKFNMRQQVFPSNIIANMFGFKIKEYFQIEEEAAKGPVKVQF
jgi:LemA protein